MQGIEVTLSEMQERMELRAARQREILAEFHCPVISFSMNIPGSIKTNEAVRSAFDCGTDSLLHELSLRGFNIGLSEEYHGVTGDELFVSADAPAEELKSIAVHIEETRPLGRLYDIDVININGEKISRPCSRECPVCGRRAQECARSRTHTFKELQDAVEDLLHSSISKIRNNPENVPAWLKPDSPIRRIICLDTVDSTNNYAKNLTYTENGTLITANCQTAGRGRMGHSFSSPAGTGLYMTLVLRPDVEPERFQMITIAAAAAVCLTLEELTPARPLVKWVNDIFLRGEDGRERKVCGILAEAMTGSKGVERLVVGIGINLTTRDFGADIRDTAGSVFPNGIPDGIYPARIAAGITERLMAFADNLTLPYDEGCAELIRVYRERSMLLGRDISYMTGDEKKCGRAVDIDERGGLVVENESGARTALRSGEVHEIRPLKAY